MEIAIVTVCFKLKKDSVRQSLTERLVVMTPKHSLKKVHGLSIQKVESLKSGMMKEVPGMDVSYTIQIKFVKPLDIFFLDEKGKEVVCRR